MKIYLFCLLLIFSLASSAQTNRYFVTFKDKNSSNFSISDPIKFLSQRSLDRRAKLGARITLEDIPVNVAYVNQLKSTGAKTFFTSKWWNGVLIQADQSLIPTINALPFVLKSELVAPGAKLIGGRISSIDKSNKLEASSETTQFQLQQLVLDKMQEQGYRGEGVLVAQFDSGWIGVNSTSPFQHLFQEGRIKGTFNFIKNITNVFTDDIHGTEVLSVMAALLPGQFTGGAYKADYYLFQTEDKFSEYRVEEYNWAFGAEKADSLGVDVINSSLGYNEFDDPSMNYTIFDLTGKKAVVSITARKAVEKGIVVVCSAGNEGANNFWKFVTAPADADGVLSVGSITSLGAKSSFSSIGPTTDGRLKPDVVALGSGTAVVNGSGSTSTASGTSLSGPLVACLATGLVQAFPSASPLEIYQAIVRSANQYKKPDNQLGYGVPSFNIAKSYLKYGDLKYDVSLFPNPVSNQFLNILLKDPNGKPVSVVVYDLLGKKILDTTTSIDWTNNPLQYDMTNLPIGVYLVSYKSDNAQFTKKIIKSN